MAAPFPFNRYKMKIKKYKVNIKSKIFQEEILKKKWQDVIRREQQFHAGPFKTPSRQISKKIKKKSKIFQEEILKKKRKYVYSTGARVSWGSLLKAK